MKILFLGDFFFDYDIVPKDFQALCRVIKQKNYRVILNLETTFGDKGTPISKRGPHLQSSPLLIKALKELNVLAVCLANNHAMDLGAESLEYLCKQLDKAGILYVGAGANLKEAIRPLPLPNTNVLLQNFAWNIEEAVYATSASAGVGPLNHNLVLHQTAALKKQYPNSFIINIYHWGFEYNLLPMPLDIRLARNSVKAGAELIIGHHPHVIQARETYQGKSIFYSLGNFYFGSRRINYNLKFKKYPVTNACDFGCGIVFDTDTKNCEEIISIVYNRETNQSEFQKINLALLPDITGINCDTKVYKEQVKASAENFNPILTNNRWYNACALIWLHIKYFIAGRLRFMKNTKLGKKIFEWGKRK